MAFPHDQFNVFVVLDDNGLQTGRVFEQAPAGEKMLVEEAAVRSLNAAQLARIQNIGDRGVRRHKWTLTQRYGRSRNSLLARFLLTGAARRYGAVTVRMAALRARLTGFCPPAVGSLNGVF
jgi:hypothetical protein